MTRQTTNSHPMHQALWVMLIVLAMALISAKPLAPFFGDNFGNLLTVRSLAEDGDLDIRNQLATAQVDGSGYVALGKSGELFSVHEVLLAAVGAPFYLACGEQGLIFLMALMTSLALWAVFSINQQIAPSTGLFVATTIFGVSSLPLLAFQNDLFASCLFVLALCAGVHKRSYLSGLLAGFIPAARLPFAPLLLPLLLFPLLQRSRTRAIQFLVALLPGLFALLALNQHMFGSPLIVSYFRQAYEGAEGMRVIDMRQTHFVGDIPEALGYILLSWPQGLLARNLLLPLGIVLGLRTVFRRHFALAVTTILAHLVLLVVFVGHPDLPNGLSRYVIPAEILYLIPTGIGINLLIQKVCRRNTDSGGVVAE